MNLLPPDTTIIATHLHLYESHQHNTTQHLPLITFSLSLSAPPSQAGPTYSPTIPSRHPNHTNCNGHYLNPHDLLIPRQLSQHLHNMPHFMLQHHTKFNSSTIPSLHFESLWDSLSSTQSSLSSTLGSILANPEGSSQEPSINNYDFRWDSTYGYDVVDLLEKMKLDERDSSKYHHGYGNRRLESSNVGVCSLLQEQIQVLSRIRQEQILSQKQISEEFEKRVRGVDVVVGCDNINDPTIWHTGSHQQQQAAGSSGTGVFLPRGRTTAPLESRKRPAGKGCSTVLIPARVVQALQLHFEQMAATSGPKPAGFPPLHDVLLNNRDGMYSLQKRQSRDKAAHIQNEMILPREWTY